MNLPENVAFTSLPAQYGRLISVHVPCPEMTLPQFLRYALGSQRFYWESKRDDVAFAGIGIALELMAYGDDRFETIQHHAMELFANAMILDPQKTLAAPRLFGGFSFRNDFVPDVAWSDFTPAHFVLPHYQLVRVQTEHWLSINVHVPYGENPVSLLPELKAALYSKAEVVRAFQPQSAKTTQPPIDLSYPMPYETWQRNLIDATRRIKRGGLNKVVLSRMAELRFDDHVPVDNALDFLSQAYPDTYRFLFEPRPYHAFYGATPELLASVNGTQIETMALAGSVQHGDTPEEIQTNAQALLDSDKDRYEHQLVIDGILTRLEPITNSIEVAETRIMTLRNIQHMHTAISAKLQSADGIIPVVEALHPTPALGGDPQAFAMQLIAEYEPVPRGWYAAPVGWIDRNLNGQFSVAIRSAVAQDKRVWLYAGAGIVKDSEPQKEWDETALKFAPMLNALGINAE